MNGPYNPNHAGDGSGAADFFSSGAAGGGADQGQGQVASTAATVATPHLVKLPPPPPPPPPRGGVSNATSSGVAGGGSATVVKIPPPVTARSVGGGLSLPPPPPPAPPSKFSSVGTAVSGTSAGGSVGGTTVGVLPPPPSMTGGSSTLAPPPPPPPTAASTASSGTGVSGVIGSTGGVSSNPGANTATATPTDAGVEVSYAPTPTPPPPPPPPAPMYPPLTPGQVRYIDNASVEVLPPGTMPPSYPFHGVLRQHHANHTTLLTQQLSRPRQHHYHANPTLQPHHYQPAAWSPTAMHHPLLAERHRGVPVLVVPTQGATHRFATRNNVQSLRDLFQLIATTTATNDDEYMARHAGVHPSALASTQGKKKAVEYPLPPFRSIQRTIYFEGMMTTHHPVGALTNSTGAGRLLVRFVDAHTMDPSRRIFGTGTGITAPQGGDGATAAMSPTEVALAEAARASPQDEDDAYYEGLPTPSSTPGAVNTASNPQENAADQDDARAMERMTQRMQSIQNEQRASAHNPTISSSSSHSFFASTDEDGASTPSSDPLAQVDRTLLWKLTSSSDASWMRRYRSTLDDATDNLPSEMVHCPACILLVASTHDKDYMRCLRELVNVHHLPRAYTAGQFDTGDAIQGQGGAKRIVLLLHDASAYKDNGAHCPPHEDEEEGLPSTGGSGEMDGTNPLLRPPDFFDESAALRELRREFGGMDCAVMTLNTRRLPRHAVSHDGSAGSNSEQNVTVPTGMYLSELDIINIRSFITSKVVKDGIIPTMERRVFHLNGVVSNAKKGMKNVLSRFLRKPTSFMGSSSSGSGSGSTSSSSHHHHAAAGGSGSGDKSLHGYEVSPDGKVMTSMDSNSLLLSPSSSSMDTQSTTTDASIQAQLEGASAYRVRYRYDAIESQTRLLADSLFLMRDYEAALSCYRLVKDDYKSDKALVYYASIQEMIALCLFLIEGGGSTAAGGSGSGSSSVNGSISGSMAVNSMMDNMGASMMGSGSMHGGSMHGGGGSGGMMKYGREIHAAIESALYSYTRAADEERFQQMQLQSSLDPSKGASARPQHALVSTRLATRLCLVVSSFFGGGGTGNYGSSSPSDSPSSSTSSNVNRHLEIADLLASASSHETPMGAAVLLEQASGHYLRANLVRKYGFHMLMSGHMYRSCKQERHGMRCFTSALHVYHMANWKELFDHLQSALAQQLYSLPPSFHYHGRSYASMALQFYCQLMGSGTGRISARSQHKFLQHFMEICRSMPQHAMDAAGKMLPSSSFSGPAPLPVGYTQVLEIPDIDLPRVEDGTVAIHSPSTSKTRGVAVLAPTEGGEDVGIEVDTGGAANIVEGATMDSIGGASSFVSSSSIGGEEDVYVGLEGTWSELETMMEAEMKGSPATSDSPAGPAETAEEEEERGKLGSTDRFFSELDALDRAKSRNSKSLLKKGAGGQATVRAKMEPLTVSLTLCNPLGIPLHLTEVQLVATLECSEPAREGWFCTNENAFLPTKEGNSNDTTGNEDGKEWTFPSSKRTFRRPTFFRTWDRAAEKANNPFLKEDTPFFVVEKHTMLMEPGAAENVTLGICPLVEGHFHVVGLRCKLFNEVWVYHAFQLKGPLLQDTRLNRSNRVRGENYLLKSKVEEDMPLLTVDIHGARLSALQGEVATWTMQISNLGSASASNMHMKTNLPWLCIDEESDVSSSSAPLSSSKSLAELRKEECRATSNCVGLSGTLMKLPLKEGAGEVSFPNVLHAGESISLPMRAHASGGGKQELYMLFRYDLLRNDTDSVSSNVGKKKETRRRFVRKFMEISVFPSLTVTASLMPSYWKKQEHVLSLELTNYRSDRQVKLDVELTKVCIASRFYHVVQLPGQFGNDMESKKSSSNTDDGKKPGFRVGWQERCTLHFIVVPMERSMYKLTKCAIPGQVTPLDSTIETIPTGHVTDFPCLESAHEKLSSALTLHKEELERIAALGEDQQQHPRSIAQIRRQNTRAATTDDRVADDFDDCIDAPEESGALAIHPTSVGSLCPDKIDISTINVICLWKATSCHGADVSGQHHLLHLPVRPKSKNLGCPLTITAKHETEIHHNFNTGPREIDLDITVCNRLVNNSDESFNHKEQAVEFEFAVMRQVDFEFIGVERFDWALEAGDELTIPLKVLFTAAGVYNLQSVRLTVFNGPDRKEKIPYLFPLQWIVKVSE